MECALAMVIVPLVPTDCNNSIKAKRSFKLVGQSASKRGYRSKTRGEIAVPWLCSLRAEGYIRTVSGSARRPPATHTTSFPEISKHSGMSTSTSQRPFPQRTRTLSLSDPTFLKVVWYRDMNRGEKARAEYIHSLRLKTSPR